MAVWLLANGLLVAGAYLLGSISPGYLAGQWLEGIDIRHHGSGSTGATNVLRTLGKGPALAVLLFDLTKGTAAIAFTRWLYTTSSFSQLAPTSPGMNHFQPWVLALVGLAVLLGHSLPLWLNFQGGKSAATSLGLLLALNWMVGLGTLTVFATILLIFRIVSLGSIAAAIAAPLLMVSLQQPLAYDVLAIAGGLYVIGRHQGNIRRLWTGTEPKVGQDLGGRNSKP